MPLEFAGAVTASTSYTQVTSGAGAGTKGAYTQLIASTARQSHEIVLFLLPDGNKNNFQVFVATGSAGSETDVMQVVYWSGSGSGRAECIRLPLTIASGARVAVAVAAGAASQTLRVGVCLSDVSAYGTGSQHFVAGVTGGGSGFQGTDVDPGATINTKGAWTQLTASTPNDADLLLVCIGMSQNNNLLGGNFLVDIATGGSGSETAIIENIPVIRNASEEGYSQFTVLHTVASGTRLSARAQCTINDASDRIVDVSVVGVNLTAPAGGGGAGIARLVGPGLAS